MRYNPPCVCGRSSSGRARPCQGRGSEFEPRRPLQKEKPLLRSGFSFWNAAGRFELTASTCAKRVKSRGEAGFLRMASAIRGMPGSEFEPRRPLHKASQRRLWCFFFYPAMGGGGQRRWRCTGQRGCSLLRKRIPPLNWQQRSVPHYQCSATRCTLPPIPLMEGENQNAHCALRPLRAMMRPS